MSKKPTKHTKSRSDSAPLEASSLLRKRHKAGMKARKELEIEDPFELEEAKLSAAGGPMSLKDKMSHDSSVLKSDWALFGGELSPQVYLETSKGYSPSQAKRYLDFEGESTWFEERTKVQNAILEKMAKRNVDQIVETNEYFIRGAKLGLMKIMESLSKNPSKLVNPLTGRWEAGLSMKDLNDMSGALNNIQSIYMKAMGVHPKENVGINNIINQMKVVNVSAHISTPSSHSSVSATGVVTTTEGSAPDPRMEAMGYDEMFKVIEMIRDAGMVKDPEVDGN